MLPVVYDAPVTPPSPLDRPPPRRRPRTLLLLATVFIATPIAAIAVLGHGETETRPAKTIEGAVVTPRPADPPAAAEPAAEPAPAAAATATTAGSPPGPMRGPQTSGGSQPYIADPNRTASENATAAKPGVGEPAAETAARSNVRVIDLTKKPESGPVAVVPQPKSKAAEAAAPAVVTPSTAAPSPAAPTNTASIAPTATTGAATAPQPLPSRDTATLPPIETKSADEAVPLPRPRPPAPVVVTADPKDTAGPTQGPRRSDVRRPQIVAGADPETFTTPIEGLHRRDAGRSSVVIDRQRAPVEVWDDDAEVVPPPPRRRGWTSWVPFIGDPGPRPTLRAYPMGPTYAEKTPVGENCHWHAWPVEGMVFHREVRCHWHSDPDDPSIRYTSR